MARRIRLDAELVRRGHARSRENATELIDAGRVLVDGQRATKASTQIDPAQALFVDTEDLGPSYASRGAHKLIGALDALADLGLEVAGRRALDAGASTGGFTDVLLRRGVAEVVAVDVGYGQLVWALQNDPRVTVLDRTNVRYLAPESVAPAPDLVVADLSFISLKLVLPALAACAASSADFVLMVKPQFEVGKDRLGTGGVVRDPAHRAGAVLDVLETAVGLGLSAQAVVPSPLPGPSGNVEYFIWLARRDGLDAEARQAAVVTAVENGPTAKRSGAVEPGAEFTIEGLK